VCARMCVCTCVCARVCVRVHVCVCVCVHQRAKGIHLCKLFDTACYVFCPHPFTSGPSKYTRRILTFMSLPDMSLLRFGITNHAFVRAAFMLVFFWLVSGFFQASAQMPPRGIYSDVTLPYASICVMNTYHPFTLVEFAS